MTKIPGKDLLALPVDQRCVCARARAGGVGKSPNVTFGRVPVTGNIKNYFCSRPLGLYYYIVA